jgi:vacuolar-type H+-ATPase subunit H
MKLTITNFLARPALYVSLVFAGLTLTNCSNDDDNTPEEFEFEEQFEDIGEMPELNIEEITLEEVDLGGVEQSEATANVLSDLEAGGDLSAETQTNLNTADNFAASLSAGVQDEAANLTDARIDEILAMSSLDGDLAAAATALENAPADVLALLPAINFSADFDTATAQTRNGIDLDSKDEFSEAFQEGPCYDAANDAFDAALEEPAATLATQLEEITNYENDKVSNVNTMKESAETNISEATATYLAEIATASKALLAYAQATDDDARAAALRNYAVLYLIKGKSDVSKWNSAATALVAQRLTENLARITAQILNLENTANGNFEQIRTRALTVLNTALNTCHNQGGGN